MTLNSVKVYLVLKKEIESEVGENELEFVN
jgi:hypothetical protein